MAVLWALLHTYIFNQNRSLGNCALMTDLGLFSWQESSLVGQMEQVPASPHCPLFAASPYCRIRIDGNFYGQKNLIVGPFPSRHDKSGPRTIPPLSPLQAMGEMRFNDNVLEPGLLWVVVDARQALYHPGIDVAQKDMVQRRASLRNPFFGRGGMSLGYPCGPRWCILP